MKKRYFSKKSRWEPKLFVIMGGITLFIMALFLAPRLLSEARLSLPRSSAPPPDKAQEILENAYALVSEEKWNEAEPLLQPLLRGTDSVIVPRALMLQADIRHGQGNFEAALSLLSDAVAKYRNSTEYPFLLARHALQLEKMGRRDEAKSIYETLRSNASAEGRALGNLGLGSIKEAEQDLVAAQEYYRSSLDDAPRGSSAWESAVEAAGRLNVQLIFSPQETPESKIYTVEQGDTITSIGNKLNTTQGLLMTANGISDPARLNVGQRLKYTPKDFHIVIERSTCSLFLCDTRGIFKRYKVGLGKPGHETTLGRYTIGTKQKDPVWHKPGHGPIPAGHAENELGTRWMPLAPVEEGLPKDLGIHGTIAPETIGAFSSKGCARMHNHDVEELWDLVVRATPVEIVEIYNPQAEEEPDSTLVAQPASAGESQS